MHITLGGIGMRNFNKTSKSDKRSYNCQLMAYSPVVVEVETPDFCQNTLFWQQFLMYSWWGHTITVNVFFASRRSETFEWSWVVKTWPKIKPRSQNVLGMSCCLSAMRLDETNTMVPISSLFLYVSRNRKKHLWPMLTSDDLSGGHQTSNST